MKEINGKGSSRPEAMGARIVIHRDKKLHMPNAVEENSVGKTEECATYSTWNVIQVPN